MVVQCINSFDPDFRTPATALTTGTETRAVAETGMRTGAGSGTEKGMRIETEGREG